MQFRIVSSTVINDQKPVDNRNWIQRFRDWMAHRVPVPVYNVKYAIFQTHDYKPPVGATIILENGTSWIVTNRRTFGFYADSKTALQADDIKSSHAYKGYAVEVQYACPDDQEERLFNRNVHV